MQEDAAKLSCPQSLHQDLAKQWAKMPHSRYLRKAWRTKGFGVRLTQKTLHAVALTAVSARRTSLVGIAAARALVDAFNRRRNTICKWRARGLNAVTNGIF